MPFHQPQHSIQMLIYNFFLPAQEQLRMEKLLAEEAELTFLPVINPYYSVQSRPLLDLKDPEPYLAHARARKLKLEAERKLAAEEEQVRCSWCNIPCKRTGGPGA